MHEPASGERGRARHSEAGGNAIDGSGVPLVRIDNDYNGQDWFRFNDGPSVTLNTVGTLAVNGSTDATRR
jgi:hypothetical protein